MQLIKNHILANKGVAFLILLTVLLTIIDKLLFPYAPFWGLEYEDAYIYADTGRYMLHNYQWSVDRLMTKSISIGSLAHPCEFITYATHSEAFSYIIYTIHKIFGYWYCTPLLLSSLSSIIGYIVLSVVALKNRDFPILRFFICGVAFLASPLARTFQSSGVSEALSSLPVLITLIGFISIFSSTVSNSDQKILCSVLTITAFSASVLIKRENLVLLSIPLIGFINTPRIIKNKTYCLTLLGVFAAAFIYVFILPPTRSFSAESSDIGTSAFSLHHFMDNAPKFIECMFRIDMWGITGYMLIAAIVLSRKEWRNPTYQFPIALLSIYFLAYTFHFRSIYQVQTGKVDAFEMMRFSVNVFPIAVLLIVNSKLPNIQISKFAFYSATTICFAMIGLSSFYKVDYSRMEFAERIQPILKALSLCGSNSVLVTDVPSLARIYSNKEINIIQSSRISFVLSDTNIFGNSVEYVVVNRPDEFNDLNNLFISKGLLLNKQTRFNSYDLNIYSFNK